MCLVLVAWDCHPKYQVVLAANRDEFHARPAAPMNWWHEVPDMLAGRDLRAGGTWMGIGTNGRFGALANYYLGGTAPAAGLRSRGDLIPGWITAESTLGSYASNVASAGRHYLEFNCLLGDLDGLYLVSNCDALPLRALSPGIHGLSNDLVERPFPKVTASCQRLESIVSEHREIEPDTLLTLLGAREVCTGAGEKVDTQDRLSVRRQTPMVIDGVHGTRCATVILVGRDGLASVVERRFDPAGHVTGQDEFRFSIGLVRRAVD